MMEPTNVPCCHDCGLVNQRSGLCTASAEDDCGNRNTCGIVEFLGEAGAVGRLCGEAGVRMSAGRLDSCRSCRTLCNPTCSPRPVDSVLRRVVVETFPPNGVVVEVHGTTFVKMVSFWRGVESVRVGLFVCAGSNAEEAVFGVDCPQTTVRDRF